MSALRVAEVSATELSSTRPQEQAFLQQTSLPQKPDCPAFNVKSRNHGHREQLSAFTDKVVRIERTRPREENYRVDSKKKASGVEEIVLKHVYYSIWSNEQEDIKKHNKASSQCRASQPNQAKKNHVEWSEASISVRSTDPNFRHLLKQQGGKGKAAEKPSLSYQTFLPQSVPRSTNNQHFLPQSVSRSTNNQHFRSQAVPQSVSCSTNNQTFPPQSVPCWTNKQHLCPQSISRSTNNHNSYETSKINSGSKDTRMRGRRKASKRCHGAASQHNISDRSKKSRLSSKGGKQYTIDINNNNNNVACEQVRWKLREFCKSRVAPVEWEFLTKNGLQTKQGLNMARREDAAQLSGVRVNNDECPGYNRHRSRLL